MEINDQKLSHATQLIKEDLIYRIIKLFQLLRRFLRMVSRSDSAKKIGNYMYKPSSTPLGKGAFGTVYKGYEVDKNNKPLSTVAIKIISSDLLKKGESLKNQVEREIKIL